MHGEDHIINTESVDTVCYQKCGALGIDGLSVTLSLKLCEVLRKIEIVIRSLKRS